MRLSVVLNSMAGALLGRPVTDFIAAVEHAFEAAGHRVVCTAAPGRDVEEAIRRAAQGMADVVVVGGGDGTIATAARVLAGTGKALGVLPLGTMNLLARDLGIPFDLNEAAQALANGEIGSIDLGEVNGRPFLNNSVIGLYARMVQEREHQRHTHNFRKWPAMAIATVKTLVDYPRLEVTIDVGDGPRRLVTPVLAVANNIYDEGFGPILRRASLTGGQLAIYVGRHDNRRGLVRLLGSFLVGKWMTDPRLEVHQAHEAVVSSRRPRLRVANDGEIEWMATPLHYRIRPGGLRVLRPRQSAPSLPLRDSA